uniref:Rab-GAP TBC domain-containing protein n=2 Tax=Anopheles gambiae TaxID=7165 RepID=A0A903WZV9_ANOGA
MSFLFSSIKNLTVGGTGASSAVGSSAAPATTTPSTASTGPIVSCYQESEEMRFNALSPPPPPPPPPPSASSSDYNISKKMGVPDTQSDFNQWLHAMKMVARLPGGMPSEFRRKLWMALADRYLKTRSLNWEEESARCLSEQSDEDDEELGIQIVKDLHRTGSSLCSGPSGTINQGKLKRVLLGYSRFNPEVGYCQGFNMLGALILQVMDKSESDSIKVMILLIEGLLPAGYFCGSLGGLQADMAVFRDLLGTRLPKLARHLQKLQGPEGAFEPPLTNVFTMQWFLTLFCTCLPIPLVLRVWDLILIEGSDVLLRTALAIWGILESKILATKTADDFYCKMGALSSELVNGSLVDSNALIQRVVDIGPIADLQRLRDKHLNSITQLKDTSNLKIFYSDDEGESDEDSRLAVTATAWGLRSGRRASLGIPPNFARAEGKEKMNLDISLLKKQYDKLRERQRQAHIILTAAVARQPANPSPNAGTLQVNQLLVGKNALLSAKGKRLGPPQGAVPPVRSGSKSSSKQSGKQSTGPSRSPKPVETLHWKDMDETKQRRNSLKWKDLPKDGATKKPPDEGSKPDSSPKLKKSASASSAISNLSETGSSGGDGSSSARTGGALKRRSESSSYSEESDGESSTSTSLCDDDNQPLSASSLEASPMKRRITPESIIREVPDEERLVVIVPSDSELTDIKEEPSSYGEDEEAELSRASEVDPQLVGELLSPLSDVVVEPPPRTAPDKLSPTSRPIQPEPEDHSLSVAITSTSQLSPIPDITKYVSMSTISPLKTPSSLMDYSDYLANIPTDNTVTVDVTKSPTPMVEVARVDAEPAAFKVSDEGVTNELFERINAAERPSKLDLHVIKERRVSESLVTTAESVLDRSDATSKLDNYSFTNVSNRSSMSSSFVLELPIKSTLQHDSPLLPPSVDLAAVVERESSQPKQQPKYQIADALCTPTPQDETAPGESPEDIERYLANRVKFLKEKSFSMDDPIKGEDLPPEDITKRSASEGLVAIDSNPLKSDKMLEIIKENSLILGRIVRKTRDQDEQRTDQLIKEDETEMLIRTIEQLPSLQHGEHSPDLKLTHSVVDELLERAEPDKPLLSPFRLKFECEPTVPSAQGETDVPMFAGEDIKSKTDLLIQRTEEQLARFAPPEPTYYVRKDNFREIITPEEEKVTTEPAKGAIIESTPAAIVPPPPLPTVVKEPDPVDPVSPTAPLNLSFNAIDTRAVSSKTEELIKKTEEQLARFRTHDKKMIDKLEKRLSLIDMKLGESTPLATTTASTTTLSATVASSKTEEVLKKSEEQISRLALARKSPTRFKLDSATDHSATDPAPTISLKTEELIKKTDEQLARFKAAAESTAEKRKSRHELDELLRPENGCTERMLSRSCESIRSESLSSLDETAIVRQVQEQMLRTIQLPDEVRTCKTDELIRGIEDGKIKLGDDYITTIKTIDYLKRSNANMLATLSSIENSIKTIDNYCDYESDIQSDRINDTIDNLEKSLKQFDAQHPAPPLSPTRRSSGPLGTEPPLVMVHDYSTTHHEARSCRPTSCNRPSRPRKRKEYSPRRRKDKERDADGKSVSGSNNRARKDHSSDYSSDNQSVERESPKTYTYASYYSHSPPITPRLVSPSRKLPPEPANARPTTLKSTSHDRYTLALGPHPSSPSRFDKSPSSPIITKAYLESLKPATPVASGRTTRSAENSPPYHPNQPVALSPTSSVQIGRYQAGTLRSATAYHDPDAHSHIKSCENILMRFDYERISAIAASFPISSALSPSPTKYSSLDFKQDGGGGALSLGSLAASPNNKSLH